MDDPAVPLLGIRRADNHQARYLGRNEGAPFGHRDLRAFAIEHLIAHVDCLHGARDDQQEGICLLTACPFRGLSLLVVEISALMDCAGKRSIGLLVVDRHSLPT